MEIRFWILAGLSACFSAGTEAAIANFDSGSRPGSWTPFYSRGFEQHRLDYFYDRSRIRRRGNRIIAHWKVLGTPEFTTTHYAVEINCASGTLTELGTTIVDSEGRARELPRSELVVDRPIERNTSTNVFRSLVCH